jgi:hypothetical protein
MNPFKLFKKEQVQELKDLMIDRVDGVDRPATGRNFILAKSEDGGQPVETEERSSIWSDVFKIGSTRSFDQAPESGVKVADEGSDAMGREYDDQAYNALGGMNRRPTSMDPIPDAGAGPTLETDTRGLANKPTRFPTSVGGKLVKPLPPYDNEELGEAGDAPVRVGPNFLGSPRNSGIPDAAEFRKPEPKPVEKKVTFSDALLSPMEGTNMFDSGVKKGEGGWADVFRQA